MTVACPICGDPMDFDAMLCDRCLDDWLVRRGLMQDDPDDTPAPTTSNGEGL